MVPTSKCNLHESMRGYILFIAKSLAGNRVPGKNRCLKDLPKQEFIDRVCQTTYYR